MITDPDPKIAAVIGTSFTGKSFALGYVAAHVARPFVVVVHTKVDESYVCHGINDRMADFYAIHEPVRWVTPKLIESTRRSKRVLWMSLGAVTEEETIAFLDSLARSIMATGNLALIIDEAHQFCAPYAESTPLVRLVRGCRHYGVDVFVGTHGLKDISIQYRRVLQQLIVFQLTEGRDLTVLEQEYHIGRHVAARIANLPPHHYVYLNRRRMDPDPPALVVGAR